MHLPVELYCYHHHHKPWAQRLLESDASLVMFHLVQITVNLEYKLGLE